MLELLNLLNQHVAGTPKRLHFLGDSAFTAPDLLRQMPPAIHVTGRVVADVRLHQAPPARQPGQRGRPRRRGERLPTPHEMLRQKGLPRMTLKLFAGRAYAMRVATQVGRFYKAPEREVRLIAVEHLRGGRGVEVFYTTDLGADVETTLRRYSWRWSIEVTFHETKQHLGLTEPQNHIRTATRRTAPTALLLYSLILWWHEQIRPTPAPAIRDWRGKSSHSFTDMLAALRTKILENTMKMNSGTAKIPRRLRKLITRLTRLVELAM